MTQVTIAKDKERWNNFIKKQKFNQFLQSFEWGQFQEKLGKKIWQITVLENEKVVGEALVIEEKLPFKKNYLYSPRGPIIDSSSPKSKIIALMFEKIKEIASRDTIFWRIEPSENLPASDYQIQPVKQVQPSKTLVLDLNKEESHLLSSMHPKTRYNIRLASRHGVKIKTVNPKSSNFSHDFEIFWQLLQQTAERNKFRLHPKIYYQKMLESFDERMIKLYLAQWREKILAGGIFIFFGNTVTYLHGASGNEFRNLMAPYLLHWNLIEKAKELGFRYYDFWGIDEKKWPGLTRFKKGFGGKEVKYPGTFDLIFNKFWYKLYQVGKLLKKIR